MNALRSSLRTAIAALAVFASSQAAATPIVASMNLTAFAALGAFAPDTQTSSASWGTLLSPLAISATANVGSAATGFGASATGFGTATFAADGNSGSIAFRDFGWLVNVTGTSSELALSNHAGGHDWSYTFVADADGVFRMTFDVIGSGDTFGLWGWSILWSGAGGDYIPLDADTPTASGAFVRDVQAGEAYTVSLSNNANISGDSALVASGSMDGRFDWTISRQAVEPGSLALFAAGAAMAALAQRRSRTRPRR